MYAKIVEFVVQFPLVFVLICAYNAFKA